LFALGFAYGVAMMKYVVQIFYQSSLKLQIGNVLDVEGLLSNVIMTGILMGVAFLFPIVMTILMQLHMVSYQAFVNQRRFAYLIGIVFIMFLPPPDLISDVILFSPLIILFELTLILNRMTLAKSKV
jgi:sec-independent protein translocase protein TatC